MKVRACLFHGLCVLSVGCFATSSLASDIKPSEIFCGNHRMYVSGAVPWGPGPVNTTDGVVRDAGSGQAVCRAHANASWDAPQNFEVRGWVRLTPTAPGGLLCRPYDSEEEYIFNVALDLDWTPDPPASGESATTPLNSLEALRQYLPGQTIAAFGGYPEGYGGGPGAATIHVEVDAWGPCRGGGVDDPGHAYWRWLPPGWQLCGSETYEGNSWYVYFPGDVLPGSDRRLADGNYVSVVGTLWWDGAHRELCAPRNVTPYWAEMHSPDRVRKLTPPRKPVALRDSLIAYAKPNLASTQLCCQHGICLNDSVEETVTLQQPWPNARVVSIDWVGVNADFLEAHVLGINTVRFLAYSQSAYVALYKVHWSPPADVTMSVVNSILK